MAARGKATQRAAFVRSDRTWVRRALSAIFDFIRSQPIGSLSAALLVLVGMIAVWAPYIAPYPPFETHPDARLLGPTSAHWLGTDFFGRDTLSRVIFGARVSFQVGILATLVTVAVSTSLGVTGAYFGSVWDYILGRVVDLVQAIPFLVLLLPLTIIFGRSLVSLSIVLGLLIGIIASRVIRGATLTVMGQQYIEVAQAVGCSHPRILMRHVVPNVFPLVIVIASINIGAVIIAEASLSFLGYGVDTTKSVSWGAMLSADGRRYMITQPWLFVVPAAALGVVIFSMNMLGDALRDRLDPRLRRGR